MKGLNEVRLIGNLGGDPQLTRTPNGKSVAVFSMAINEQFKNAAGEKQETTEWVRVVCWERTADIVAEYCKKGAPVFVAGKIRTRKWEADGVTKYTTEVVSNNLILLGTRGSVPAPTENDRYQGASDAEWVKGTEITDDDIPF